MNIKNFKNEILNNFKILLNKFAKFLNSYNPDLNNKFFFDKFFYHFKNLLIKITESYETKLVLKSVFVFINSLNSLQQKL